MAKAQNVKITTVLVLTKETAGTYRFDHPDAGDKDKKPALGNVYMSKSAFPAGAPKKITVTVEATA